MRYSWGFVDSHPDRRSLVADRKSRLKALGDKSRVPFLQNMGMYVRVPPSANAGSDVFVRLAKGYVVPDQSTKKKEVCALNAEVSPCRRSQIVCQAHRETCILFSSLGGDTSWGHTRCASVELIGITFNGHRPRVDCGFVTTSRQGGPTTSPRPLSVSAGCSPFD